MCLLTRVIHYSHVITCLNGVSPLSSKDLYLASLFLSIRNINIDIVETRLDQANSAFKT